MSFFTANYRVSTTHTLYLKSKLYNYLLTLQTLYKQLLFVMIFVLQ